MIRSRRDFVLAIASAGVSAALARASLAQQPAPTMSGPMEQDAYRPVKLVPRTGAAPSMTDDARDDLEHRIKCPCGCPLDVFTCRTTDFSCAVSPAMHSDVMNLVAGGYGGTEILAAFRQVYGARVLMAPPREGFNWLGYVMPFAAIITAGLVVARVIGRWRERAAPEPQLAVAAIDATPAELEALDAAVRNDN